MLDLKKCLDKVQKDEMGARQKMLSSQFLKTTFKLKSTFVSGLKV